MLYSDPSLPRRRPALISDLLTIPGKPGNHQLENQATCVLAWLIDQSHAVGRRVLELFVGDMVEPMGQIGARTWISLAQPGGGAVFPDLSIDVVGGELQLLIEVKVSSDFATYPLADGRSVAQPDYYRHLWELYDAAGEASVRAVGTLTRTGGPAAGDLAALRARDVSWGEIREVLDSLADAADLEPRVAAVAASFSEAIATRIAPAPVESSAYDSWYAAHAQVIKRVTDRVADQLGATTVRGISGAQYRGFRVGLSDVRGEALFLRIYGSPAGARLSVAGWPDAVIVGVERDADGRLEPDAAVRAAGVGFVRLRDLDGFWLHRDMWPVERSASDSDEVADQVVSRVRSSGLVPGDTRH